MEELVEKLRSLMESARSDPGFLEFFLLGLGGMLEYVFPPFPGDVMVLLGAFLVGRYGWSATAVWAAVIAGSLAGMTLDYAFGVWVRHHDSSWRRKYRTWERMGNSIDRFDAFYRRWGALCILANRFVPAIRGAFFIAAGMAGIRYFKTLSLGLASAVAWNVILFWLGRSAGNNWDMLKSYLHEYTAAAWIAGAALLLAVVIWRVFRKRRGAGPSCGKGAGTGMEAGRGESLPQ